MLFTFYTPDIIKTLETTEGRRTLIFLAAGKAIIGIYFCFKQNLMFYTKALETNYYTGCCIYGETIYHALKKVNFARKYKLAWLSGSILQAIFVAYNDLFQI